MFKKGSRRSGFTLIELLIVIVVIAILALIVIPRVMGASRKAKEATLRANLQLIRSGLERFQADCGCYPSALTALVVAQASAPTAGVDDAGTAVTIPAGSYKGPYLNASGGIPNTTSKGLPINPFVDMSATTPDPTALATHWTLTNGVVTPTVPASGATLDGINYQDL